MQVQQTQTGMNRPRRPGLIHLAVLLAYGVLTLVMTWPMAAQFTSAIPGDGFDGWQNYWNLWWMKIALVDRITSPFSTDILYAPTGVGLYFHTLNPLNGLMTLPVQLTSGLIAAYNMVVLISWVLAGYGSFLLTLWVLQRTGIEQQESSESTADGRMPLYLGAFVAGVIYTFAPFHMAHLLGHMQVMSLQWIPFYILFLLRGLWGEQMGRQRINNGLFAGLFLIFNGLSDWYFVLYLFLFTALAIVVTLCVNLIRQLRASALSLRAVARSLWNAVATPAIAGLLFVLVLSPVLIPMVREAVQFDFMVRPPSDLYILSATVADYLIPSRLHTLWRESGHLLPGNQIAPVSERTISIGYAALVLAAIAMIAQFRRVWFWVVGIGFFILLSLGPRMHLASITAADIPGGQAADSMTMTLFGLLNHYIPFMSISRSVSRYALMVQLGMAVLAGVGLATVLQRVRTSTAAIFTGIVVGVLLVEYWVAPYPMSPPDTPAYYYELAESGNDGAVMNWPMNYDRPGYLLYQTVHGKPLTVAYISRDDPRTLTERVPLLQHLRHLGPDIIDADLGAVGQTVLSDLGVQVVVVDRYKMPTGDEREYTDATTAQVFDGVEPVYADDRITVYPVTAPDSPSPYIELAHLDWRPFLDSPTVEDRMSRAVAAEQGCVLFHHLGDSGTLTVEYTGATGVDVVTDDGQLLATLDTSSTGGTATVTIPLSVDDGSSESVCFVPQAGDGSGFEVLRLRLDAE